MNGSASTHSCSRVSVGGRSAIIAAVPLAVNEAWPCPDRAYAPPPFADDEPLLDSESWVGSARGSVVMGGKIVKADSEGCPASIEKVVLRRLDGLPEVVEGVEWEDGVGRRFKWD